MFENDEDTCSLTLRSVRRSTIEALREARTLTGSPMYHLVDQIVWRGKDHLSMMQVPLDDVCEDTCSLTLRHVRRSTVEALYAAKAATGLPICRLVDVMVVRCVEEHPLMLQNRLDQLRRLARKFGSKDGPPPELS